MNAEVTQVQKYACGINNLSCFPFSADVPFSSATVQTSLWFINDRNNKTLPSGAPVQPYGTAKSMSITFNIQFRYHLRVKNDLK